MFHDLLIFADVRIFFEKISIFVLHFSSALRFCQMKGYFQWKCKFYRSCVWNPATELLQIGRKLEKWQWHHNFSTWYHRQFFWTLSVFLVNFSYWSKVHVNFMTGSRIMTIFLYKGLTKNPKVGNAPVWVLPNIWRLRQVWDIKLGSNVSNEIFWTLHNARITAFTIFELLRENQQEG